MLRIFAGVLAVLFFAISHPALAQVKSGWEIHGGIGPSVIRDEDGTETFRGTGFGFIFGGEYRFTDHFALGLNVLSLGSADDTIGGVETEIEVDAIGFTGRIIFPLGERVEGYGLIGSIVYDADVNPGGGFRIFGEDAWEFGAGIDIPTSEQFSLRVDGRYFNGTRDESGGLLTFGFSYRF